jgi:hypothetical protein
MTVFFLNKMLFFSRRKQGVSYLFKGATKDRTMSYWNTTVFWLIAWLIFLCFNATFSNISAISWQPVLVVEEARVPEREPPTLVKQLANFITCQVGSRVHLFFCNLQSWAQTHAVLVIYRFVWAVRSNNLTHWATRAPPTVYWDLNVR